VERAILAGLLNAAFVELDAPLEATAISGFESAEEQRAFIQRGHSSSEIELRASPGLVTAHLWRKGVLLGMYRAQAIDQWNQLARVLILWCINEVEVTKLATDFPDVEAADFAEIYEQGPAPYANYMWEKITQRLEAHRPEMLPIVKLARARPELSRLFPYLSHFDLRFRHFTGFPHSKGYPWIMYLGPNKYAVQGWDGQPLGEGSPEQVVAIAVMNLPPNTQPAMHGAERQQGGA